MLTTGRAKRGTVEMGDLKVPLALVLAMAAQLVGGVWWISEQAHRIEYVEADVVAMKRSLAEVIESTNKLITFATFTENRWAEAYTDDMTYVRLFGSRDPRGAQ